ncbi:MAG: hypothetical protein QRY74_04795 [Chlamydia sp.]
MSRIFGFSPPKSKTARDAVESPIQQEYLSRLTDLEKRVKALGENIVSYLSESDKKDEGFMMFLTEKHPEQYFILLASLENEPKIQNSIIKVWERVSL